jgi:hypothetical protein
MSEKPQPESSSGDPGAMPLSFERSWELILRSRLLVAKTEQLIEQSRRIIEDSKKLKDEQS